MLNIGQIELGSVVNFRLYPSMIITSGYNRAKIEGILSFEDANKYLDATALHIQVYPTLPQGTPNNPRMYYYLKVRLLNGQTTVVGIPWIDEDSFEKVEASSIRFTIPNISHADEQIIRTQLGAIGYQLVDVEYLNEGAPGA